MSRGRLNSVLSHLQRTFGTRRADDVSDAALLDRFVRQRDEAAFELLVWRHQSMVLGVCRRLLRDEHDAEDAFQAAFLTLCRKAASIGRREALASWLYKVAYRCALRVRESVRRQRQDIVRGVDPADVAVSDSSAAALERRDLHEWLDEEVQRLPAKYRAAVVLCYLEGKSYQKAADELGCPAGTLSARLHTARERLRRRLTARGLAPAAALAMLEGVRETQAEASLAAVAVQVARRVLAGESAAEVVSSRTLEASLGVMQAMSASKAKSIAVLLLMVGLFGMTSWAVLPALPPSPREQRAEKTDKPVSAKKEQKAATWQECARLRNAIGQSPADSVHFAPDGSALAAIDGEGRLCLWNTSNWEQRWRYDLRRYKSVQLWEPFSPTPFWGTIEAWMSYKSVQLWDPFSPDGRLIHVVGEVADAEKPGQLKTEMTLLDAANGREAARLPGSNLKYSPDKTMLATAEKDGVTLWDARTFRKLRKLKTAAPVDGFYVAFSKDGTRVCIPTRARCCELWETATGKQHAKLEGFYPQISPDGKSLLTILPGGIVKLWDTTDGRERATIRKEGRSSCWPLFSADGKRLLVRADMALTADGRFAGMMLDRIRPIDVCLYDAATGVELQRLPGTSNYSVYAELSPDGRTVAYSRLEPDETMREEVVLWDVRSGRERAVLRGPSETRNSVPLPSGLRNPSFSSDGTTLRASDPSGKNPSLWDTATGRRLLTLPAEIGFVYVSPDGQWLAGVPSFQQLDLSFKGSTKIQDGQGLARVPFQQGPADIRVFHRSARKLPPPVIRGEAAKPSPLTPPPPAGSAATGAGRVAR